MTQISPATGANGSFRQLRSNKPFGTPSRGDQVPSGPSSPTIRQQRRYEPTKVLGTGTYGKVFLCQELPSPTGGSSSGGSSGVGSPTTQSAFPASPHRAQPNSSSGRGGLNKTPSTTGRYVAVKVANKEAAYRRSALNESKVLQLLQNNRETLRWIETYEENGHICIVTELLSRTVYDVMKARDFQPMSLGEVRQVATNVFRSLSALHRQGYMHCDVKPENIMLRSDAEGVGSVCLIDFGAVRALHENAYYDIQSLWYRAPEVLCSVPYSPRIDSWSMGCLVYELATGAPLFPGNSTADELSRIVDLMGSPSEEACSRVQVMSLQYAPGASQRARRTIDEKIYAIHGRSPTAEAAVDLLYGLLNPDEGKRVSCEDALCHPFLNQQKSLRIQRSQSNVQSQQSPSLSFTAPTINNNNNNNNAINTAMSASQLLAKPLGTAPCTPTFTTNNACSAAEGTKDGGMGSTNGTFPSISTAGGGLTTDNTVASSPRSRLSTVGTTIPPLINGSMNNTNNSFATNDGGSFGPAPSFSLNFDFGNASLNDANAIYAQQGLNPPPLAGLSGPPMPIGGAGDFAASPSSRATVPSVPTPLSVPAPNSNATTPYLTNTTGYAMVHPSAANPSGHAVPAMSPQQGIGYTPNVISPLAVPAGAGMLMKGDGRTPPNDAGFSLPPSWPPQQVLLTPNMMEHQQQLRLLQQQQQQQQQQQMQQLQQYQQQQFHQQQQQRALFVPAQMPFPMINTHAHPANGSVSGVAGNALPRLHGNSVPQFGFPQQQQQQQQQYLPNETFAGGGGPLPSVAANRGQQVTPHNGATVAAAGPSHPFQPSGFRQQFMGMFTRQH